MPCVEVPESLWKRLNEAAERLGEEPGRFAVRLLRAALEEFLEEYSAGVEVTEEERRVIIERLRSLGYL
ncbi:hypothetical protein Pyrfu_0403 [Pyrolobus fumarii 1A]|uniref:Ribbon-helix-helix protein CopG domain-containing protein n=1 Tax=Pyrolobus fumarii (strain DSM 11204 / 1A) TaxID=694429 RepID=G0EG27_PYRF1|nr:hypothetical protein [Pyrolobus fumarii]AEM38275.1 hypothetical protein Pyrfu_0403 [Pyrolobus fumarii 1A]